jgi:hypothetical protein
MACWRDSPTAPRIKKVNIQKITSMRGRISIRTSCSMLEGAWWSFKGRAGIAFAKALAEFFWVVRFVMRDIFRIGAQISYKTVNN